MKNQKFCSYEKRTLIDALIIDQAVFVLTNKTMITYLFKASFNFLIVLTT